MNKCVLAAAAAAVAFCVRVRSAEWASEQEMPTDEGRKKERKMGRGRAGGRGRPHGSHRCARCARWVG